MLYKDAIVQAGVDVEGTLRRFSGNEKLMRKYVLKFPEDKSVGQLEAAIASMDYAAMAVATHTLKGVCGNLGLTSLYEQAKCTNDKLKGGLKDIQVLEECEKLLAMCKKACDILRSVQD